MSALEPLRALLNRMQEEDNILAKKIDFLTAQIIESQNYFYSNFEEHVLSADVSKSCFKNQREGFQLNRERMQLKSLQGRFRSHIRIVLKIIEEKHISFDAFPVIQDIELAERLADGGRIEEEKDDYCSISINNGYV